MEDHLNRMGYTDREEERILEVLGRGLLREFPNPSRTGCPPSGVLKRIASHDTPLCDAEKWLDHLGSCSPCYRDYLDLQAANRNRRQWVLFAAAAGILLAILVMGRTLISKHNELPSARTAVLDLSNRSFTRGVEQESPEAPLEVSRYASHWEIQLPLGSPDGPYEVRLTTVQGEQIFAASGVATITEGTTLLRIEVGLSQAGPGPYVLQIRRPKLVWTSYSLVVH
jgi:hypothetical protein